MITALEARKLTDDANSRYTVEQVLAFVEERAAMGFGKCMFAVRRWSPAVDDVIHAAGFKSLENDRGQVEVSRFNSGHSDYGGVTWLSGSNAHTVTRFLTRPKRMLVRIFGILRIEATAAVGFIIAIFAVVGTLGDSIW